MKVEKWAVIADVVGALAVVMTLIVLIVEVRGNTDAIRSQTAQGTFDLSAQSFYYPEGTVALDKWFSGDEELTSEERAHARALLAAILTTFDNHYYQYRRGNLEAEIHEAYRARLEAVLRNPPARDFWQERRSLSTRAFQEYVDEIIEDLERQ